MVFLVTIACNNKKKKTIKPENQTSQTDSLSSNEATQGEMITLEKITDFPSYKDVTLTLEEPAKNTLQAGKQHFNFKVKGMKLGEQTKGADKLGIANAEDGQHIHFIIDNKPYMAFYEKDFEQDLAEGTHTLVAFPARSYHMSVKNKDAVVAKKIQVGNAKTDQFKDVDFKKPTLIYSRPKGDYVGASETAAVLLDFYLLNTDLSKDGYKVRAIINDDQEFLIDEWAPYEIKGLPMGENKIKLELIDKDGNTVEGTFNSVERTFNLKK